MFLSYWLKCSPSFQVKIRKHYKSEFLKQKYFQKGLMSLQAPDISEHLSVSSVIFGRTSDVPAISVRWQTTDSTGHIKVAVSEWIAWEVVSLKLCLLNNAHIFCPLWHLLQLWSYLKSELRLEKERRFETHLILVILPLNFSFVIWFCCWTRCEAAPNASVSLFTVLLFATLDSLRHSFPSLSAILITLMNQIKTI